MRQAERVRSDSRHQALFSGEILPGDRVLLFLYFFQGEITGKELDTETGYYYFGARYLDPKTSRWISVDPAMGDYIPSAPVNDEARKRNGNLPGQGGVFNYVNLHVYHYAGNNPVKYTDPDGRDSIWQIDEENKTITITIPVEFAKGTTAEQQQMFYEAAKGWEGKYLIGSDIYSVSVNVVEIVGSKKYDGIKVNTVTFSPIQRDDNGKPPLIPNVIGSKDMTLYDESGMGKTLRHEIGHLMGMKDHYNNTIDSATGNRVTPAQYLWESNIMATLSGVVGGRNFEEGLQNKKVNKLVYMK